MDINTLPRYQCHKIVRAAKLTRLEAVPNSEPDYNKKVRLICEGAPGPIDVDAGVVARMLPGPGWYFIVYDDGYQSFRPAKAFEEGYTLMDRLGAYEGQKIGDVNPGGPVDGLSG